MSVWADLSEEEAYLWAILTDASGIDFAEFTFYEADAEGEVFRAWNFQWPWWHAEDRLQIDSAGRAVGKSQGIVVRATSFVFRYPGRELVLTAPEALHLDLITQRIEQRIMGIRLTREMITKKRQIRHRPFEVDFQNGSRILGRIPHRDGTAVKGCIWEDHLILTSRGLIEAKNVEVGDEIWTHKSRWMPVTEVQRFEDDIYEVDGIGITGWASEKSHSPGGLKVSGRHRFYGRYNLSTPKQKRKFSEPQWSGLKDLDKFFWSSPALFNGEEKIPGDPRVEMNGDFWWVVGLWVADGYTHPHGYKKKDGTYTLREANWTVHSKKQVELLTRLKRLGFTPRIKKRAHSSADLITVSPSSFAHWLDANFGKLAGGKELPIWLLFQPREIKQAFLDGYLYGDGTIEKRTTRGKDQASSSASKKLTLGLKLLAQSLGYAANMTAWQPNVTQIRGTVLKSKPQMSWRLGIPERGQSWFDDEFSYGRIRGIRPTDRGNVVNIICDDHSYVAEGIICHNTHGIVLELDEGQDYPDAGWEELIETLNRAGDEVETPPHWYVHGVTRGIRDYFHKFTLPDSGWKVHKIPSMIRPGWTDSERQEKIAMYGSRNAPSYRRNILGDPGDAEASIFVMTRLMACVDLDEGSHYNQVEYHCERIAFERLAEDGITIEQALQLPMSHKDIAQQYTMWGGADLGMTSHPSEFLIFAEIPRKGDTSLFKLVARFHLERVRARDQVSAIIHLIDFYNVKAFGLDKTGLGLPIYQDLQDRSPEYLDRIKGYNFSSKILVDFDKAIEVDAIKGDRIKDAGIEKNVLEESTDVLRRLVDTNRFRLPNDLDVVKEFQGQTYQEIKTGMDQYGRTRRFSTGTFHALDAARMAGLSFSQHAIEELTKPQDAEDVLDVFFLA